jgi:hypothetical protein
MISIPTFTNIVSTTYLLLASLLFSKLSTHQESSCIVPFALILNSVSLQNLILPFKSFSSIALAASLYLMNTSIVKAQCSCHYAIGRSTSAFPKHYLFST